MTTLNIREIMDVLPHRYPMLLVDRIIECDDKKHIVGIKNLTMNEPFFMGHFPDTPIMPGVLQLEAIAQTAGILLIRVLNLAGRIPYFIAIDRARFRKVLQPGDQMRIEVDFHKLKRKIAMFSGRVLVDGELACEAEMMCMVAEDEPKV